MVKRHPRFWRAESGQSSCKDRNPSNCEITVDDSVTYGGTPSCLLQNPDYQSTSRGMMVQTMGAKQYQGKRIRFSARVSTTNLQGEAGLFVRILDSLPSLILEDDMDGRRVTGTNDWVALNVVIDVPSEARYINFGALLNGGGKLWIADLAVSEVGSEIALTENGSNRYTKYNGPTNFELEEDQDPDGPKGWTFSSDSDQIKHGLQRIEKRSALWISSKSELTPKQGERSSENGTYTQRFNCAKWRGQRVKFSADIKYSNVGDWCGLMMWVKGVTDKTLGFTTMYDRLMSGDSDWQRCSVVLDVPPVACSVIVAVTLKGNGEVYFSNLSFDAAARTEETTDQITGPKNLSFEE